MIDWMQNNACDDVIDWMRTNACDDAFNWMKQYMTNWRYGCPNNTLLNQMEAYRFDNQLSMWLLSEVIHDKMKMWLLE